MLTSHGLVAAAYSKDGVKCFGLNSSETSDVKLI